MPSRFSSFAVAASTKENVQLPKVHGRVPYLQHSTARTALGQTDTLIKKTAMKTEGVKPPLAPPCAIPVCAEQNNETPGFFFTRTPLYKE